MLEGSEIIGAVTSADRARCEVRARMTEYRASVLGEIWWPMGAPASLEMQYAAPDDESAKVYVETHAGDFSTVIDYTIERRDTCDHGFTGWVVVKDWETEENAAAYCDTLGTLGELDDDA